jgi:superfamily II DNA or RNA helicase
VPSIFLSGKDTTVKRREVMDDIRSGRLRHLIGTSIADEGLDMPILDALTLAGGGRSTTKVYQRIGRVLRPFAGKTDALVADFRLKQEEKINKHAGRRANVYRKELHFNFKEEKS